MTNFDYLKKEKQFDSFSEVAISSEKLLPIDREACVINCRRAMEFAVKWLYSVDASLQKPYQDNLHSLMSTEEFRALVDKGLWRRMDLIRKMGNRAAHAGAKITFDEASLCLQNFLILLPVVTRRSMRNANLTCRFSAKGCQSSRRRTERLQMWICRR